ncbi:MAG: o-succinylbenzoate synthase [Acidimicrobiales bacterium]
MTRLEGVEVVRLRLPLVAPWVTPLGTLSAREVLLCRAAVGGASGWGECVAQPDPTYSDEYVDGAADVLARHLVPRLLAAGPVRGRDVPAALDAVKGHRMAKAALEVAVLDAELRLAGRALAAYLAAQAEPAAGAPAERVEAGVAVGLHRRTDELLAEVGRHVAAGYRRVKLKVHPGADVAVVAAVRAAWPAARLALQVDANGSYAAGADPASALRPLDDHDLLLVEQPLGADDLVGHAALARQLRTPVCLDESVTSDAAAATALALGACRVVNLKPGRVGGLHEAVRIHDRCRAAGVGLWVGGMLETGVGRAANLALASLPGITLPGDLSAAERFWAKDVVTDPARLEPDGTVAVPSGPGIGVDLRGDLAAVTVRRDWYPAQRPVA